MKNKLKDVKPYIFKAYLENMREYCNKYDNIAILNQVKAFVGDENVALSDVYADFALVSKEEYDRGNGKKTFGINPEIIPDSLMDEEADFQMSSREKNRRNIINELLQKIDRRLYQLDVENALDEKEYIVKKIYRYIYIIDEENNCVECQVKIHPDDTDMSIKKIIVKNDMGCINEIRNRWVWVRGYEVKGINEDFYLFEPYWYKEGKELTEKEKEFGKSDEIIEDSK